MDVLGRRETYGAATIDGSPSTETFDRINAKQVTVEEGGGATTDVRSLSTTIDNGLDGDSNRQI